MAEHSDYITDHGWTFSYHSNLSPSYIRFAFAMSGIDAPALGRMCELAYGYGVSLLIHAACNQSTIWIGTDFNPAHAAFARKLAADAGLANLTLYDLAFEDFAGETPAGSLDAVTSMGTWSWLSPRDQETVANIAATGLAPGGIFGLSYAALPGQESTAGLTRMLAALRPAAVERGTPLETLQRAIDYLDTNPAYFGLHWGLRTQLESLTKADPAHVTHEYFNRHFRPAYFAELAEALAAHDLDWLCPWAVTDTIAGLHLTARQSAFLDGVASRIDRQQLRDFAVNRTRRSDIFVKGHVSKRSPRLDLLSSMRFVAVQPAARFSYLTRLGFAEMALARSLYEPLLSAFATLVPQSLDDLHRRVGHRHTLNDVADAVAVLTAEGFVHPVNAEVREIEVSRKPASALNRQILERSCDSEAIVHLGSPVIGSGVGVSRREQLFLLAYLQGHRTPDALATYAAQILRDGGGNTSTAGLASDAGTFVADLLPLYRALMLIEGL